LAQVSRIQPGTVVDVVVGDGVLVELDEDIDVDLEVAIVVTVPPMVVVVVDGSGAWRPQSGGVARTLDLHAFW
jgi:hypothetical protein